MTDEEIKSLHRQLSCGHRDMRERAASGLRRLDAHDLERLAEYDAKMARKARRWMILPFALGLILCVSIPYVSRAEFGRSPDFPYRLLSWILYGSGLYALSRLADRSSRVSIAEALGHSNDPSAVRLALRMLSDTQALRKSFTRKSPPAVEHLRIVLKGLLPSVLPQDTAHWTAQERDALLIPLGEPTFDTELTISSLRVLGFAGTAKARNSIKSLLQWNLWGSGGDTERIRTVAEEALALLEEHLAQNAVPGRLLRPALSPQADDLLRVPTAVVEGPETLLRASTGTPEIV